MAEMNYASKGWAALNTVLGSIGTAGTTGVLGNLFGGANCACSENMMVNRYELGLQQENAELKSQIALRDANTYSDQKMLQMYQFFNGEISVLKKEIADQKTYNAVNTATLNCISGQVAQLMSLTKTVIPITSICPTPAVATAPTAGA